MLVCSCVCVCVCAIVCVYQTCILCTSTEACILSARDTRPKRECTISANKRECMPLKYLTKLYGRDHWIHHLLDHSPRCVWLNTESWACITRARGSQYSDTGGTPSWIMRALMPPCKQSKPRRKTGTTPFRWPSGLSMHWTLSSNVHGQSTWIWGMFRLSYRR